MLTENEIKLKEAKKLEQRKIKEFALAKIKLMENKSEDEDERDELDQMKNVLNYRIKESGISPNKIGNYMMDHYDELIQKIKP